MQTLMKEADKPRKLSSLNTFPSTSMQMPNLGSHNGFNPFPALTNLQALHQLSTRSPPAPSSSSSTTTLTTQAPYQSPVNENATGISPLDLSSSNTPPLAKRIKLSPTTTEAQAQQRQQQLTSPNVTTTNNQLSTSTSGFSTLSSSSSSTTSNNSEQTGTALLPTRKCQMKINEINAWNVNEVCSFVEGIAICAEYVNVSTLFFLFLTYLLFFIALLPLVVRWSTECVLVCVCACEKETDSGWKMMTVFSLSRSAQG
jgi:hypothetical protein